MYRCRHEQKQQHGVDRMDQANAYVHTTSFSSSAWREPPRRSALCPLQGIVNCLTNLRKIPLRRCALTDPPRRSRGGRDKHRLPSLRPYAHPFTAYLFQCSTKMSLLVSKPRLLAFSTRPIFTLSSISGLRASIQRYFLLGPHTSAYE